MNRIRALAIGVSAVTGAASVGFGFAGLAAATTVDRAPDAIYLMNGLNVRDYPRATSESPSNGWNGSLSESFDDAATWESNCYTSNSTGTTFSLTVNAKLVIKYATYFSVWNTAAPGTYGTDATVWGGSRFLSISRVIVCPTGATASGSATTSKQEETSESVSASAHERENASEQEEDSESVSVSAHERENASEQEEDSESLSASEHEHEHGNESPSPTVSASASGSASLSASASESASGSASESASGSASESASGSASESASGSASESASGSASESASASGSGSVGASASGSTSVSGSASVGASASGSTSATTAVVLPATGGHSPRPSVTVPATGGGQGSGQGSGLENAAATVAIPKTGGTLPFTGDQGLNLLLSLGLGLLSVGLLGLGTSRRLGRH